MDPSSASVIQPATDVDPAWHALVIGVSRYPHLPGGGGPPSVLPLAQGLPQLSAAASSALRVARWLRDEYDPPALGQGSIRLLLSPSPGEEAPDTVPAATANAVQAAVNAWRRDVRAHADNLALMYVAGHGIQLNQEGGILLLEDFGNPNASPLAGAVDIQAVRAGIVSDPDWPGTFTPRHQFYFYDACRVERRAARNYVNLPVGVTLDVPYGDPAAASWVCFGAGPRDYAFADPDRRLTLYSQAMIDCLDSTAPTFGDGRTIRFAELHPALKEAAGRLAAEFGEDQEAEISGRGDMFVALHQRPQLSIRGAGITAETGTRPVHFEIDPPRPVEARTDGVVMGETGSATDSVLMPVGDNNEAVVPLPWGGEYVQRFDIPPGDDALTVKVEVLHPRSPRQISGRPIEARPGFGDLGCRIRLLAWTGHGFEPRHNVPAVRDLWMTSDGRMSFTLIPQYGATPYQPLLQVDSPRGPSALVALPVLDWQVDSCIVLVDDRRDGVTVDVRPDGRQSLAVAGYLRTGRADRALVAMSTDAAGLLAQKRKDPIGAAIGGYALLRLDRLDEIHDWSDNLANWFPSLPDGAVIAAIAASRRGQREDAQRWFHAALLRGVPVFTEGLSLLAAQLRMPSLQTPDGRFPGADIIAELALLADLSALCTTIQPDGLDLPGGGWLSVTPSEPGANANVKRDGE